MAEWPYPLFFEAQGLTDREKEKIRRYFQKRRDSGGGECGTIEKVGDSTYRISFMEKDVQERVLFRKLHTIVLPRGDLTLTVSRNNLPHSPSDQQSTSRQQTLTKGDTHKELEKVLPMDLHLLLYLKDSPKAAKVLQKQLSSIGCSVQLNQDEEEAVVRGDIEKDPGGACGVAAGRWELQVEKVFINLLESYRCYHVVEPEKLKILLQDLSFVTTDLIVYREGGYAVVVGENEEVKERIEILERSLPIRKECPASEKQYKLVEEEYTREMNAHCPGVKIKRDNKPNVIILEGPDKEVQSGSTKLNELIKKINQKRVQLPKALLNFMKSSSTVSKYEARFQHSLRNPVVLETGSDLVLSSLSSEALEEAAAAVQRDLRVVTLQLEGAVAVAPALDQLEEALTKAKTQVNHGGLRVEVSYHPGPSGTTMSKVQLVGYSEDVGRLKDVLLDYKLNKVEIHEQLTLPLPEMVDNFDRILVLIGLKHPKVKLTASHSPYPSVLLSGTRRLVQEAQETLGSALACLTWDQLILDGPGVQKYFQGDGKRSMELVESSCNVMIREQQGSNAHSGSHNSSTIMATGMNSGWLSRINSSISPNTPPARRHSSTITIKIGLEVKLGSLEDQQVDVLVVPMLNTQPTSTQIGSCVMKKAGRIMAANFDLSARMDNLIPGEVLQVDGTQSLGSSKVFFIECLPWDGARGESLKALQTGLRKVLELCAQQGWGSVALPVIGPGALLKFPLREAVEVLTEEIGQFGRAGTTGSVSTIRIVIKPGYPDSEQCFHDVHRDLSSNINWRGQAIFQSLSTDLDDITLTMGGGVKLQLVFGDITNETTDAVVNTTDFVDFQTPGVCKDILTLAGPQIETALKSARVKKGEIFESQPGQFHCKAILHVCGERDAGIIEGLVCDIIKSCEHKRYKSVAIPAICAGIAGLDPSAVADAILKGIKATVSSTPLRCLSLVRLVLININVFQAFKEAARQIIPAAVTNTASLSQLPSAPQPLRIPPPRSASPDLNIPLPAASSTVPSTVFLILGLCDKDVAEAVSELQRLYKAQCSQHSFTREELAGLTQEDMEDLWSLVKSLSLCVEQSQNQSGSDGQARQDGWAVSGLKDGVNQVIRFIHTCLHGSLRREVRGKEEDEVYGRVAWCILGHRGDWERLPKTANHSLEGGDVRRGVVDGYGVQWSVDLQRMEATCQTTRQVAKLKRLENLADFTLPLYWDNMAPGEQLKMVTLHSSSTEYKRVKEGFKRTAKMTVTKIERVQNLTLRRGYEVQRKHISDKHGQGRGAGEKQLYHGTTHDSCQSITQTGFNRSFAGQNATAYGQGTYFAVEASYSAHPTYSRPGPCGSQLVFVARVLTGAYTQGQSTMRVPPPRNPQQPHDRFDSVVDNVQDPVMFVVFHDNQAYPDYLITFK